MGVGGGWVGVGGGWRVGGGGSYARQQDHHSIAPLRLVPVKGKTASNTNFVKKDRLYFTDNPREMEMECVFFSS